MASRHRRPAPCEPALKGSAVTSRCWRRGGFALQRFSPFLDPCPGASPLFTPSLQSCRSATNIQTPVSVRAPSAQQHAESSCSALTPGAAAEAGGRRRLSRNGSKPLHTQAVKCTHLGGKKPPTALLAARWRFLFCFQAKEETKLSEMDGRNSAEADGTWCLKVEAASMGGSVGGWVGEGGWVRQGMAHPGPLVPLPGRVQSTIPAEPH